MSTCTSCQKTPTKDDDPLRVCGGCKTTAYCSRDCQRADWKTHKKTCPGSTSSSAKPSNPSSSSSLPFQMHTMDAAATASLQSTLDGDDIRGMAPETLYGHLVDSYRMRIEDECNFRGDFSGIYDGESPVPDFKRFLEKAEQRKGLLPGWWNDDKKDACVKFGMRTDHWFNLRCKVEKSDIQEHYKDPLMPMKIRMLAERITGSNVMG